ncbi:MAG: hypothetical protein R3F56_10985 [Planctomycetota bacterium]
MTGADTIAATAIAPPLHEIRVGVELVATPLESQNQNTTDRTPSPRRSQGAGTANERERPRLMSVPQPVESRGMRPLSSREIRALPTTPERFTFRILQSLVGADGDRLPRDFGWSYLLRQLDAVDPLGADPWGDDRAAEDAAAMQEIAPHLVSKATRRALRELPLVRDVEVWFQDFKVERLPLSGTWLDGRDEEHRELGHVSLRLRTGSDPLRVTYSVRGWRLGVSRDTVRGGFSTPLGEGLSLAVSSTFDHAGDTFDAMAELKFAVNAQTRLLLTFGNQIHLFPGPTLERRAHDELDGGAGTMVYLETIF